MLVIGILLAVAAGLVYLWKRLVHDTLRRRSARIAGTVVLILLTLLIPAARGMGETKPPSVAGWVAWPGFLWLALMMYLGLTLIVLEIPRLVIRLRMRRAETAVAATGAEPEPETAVDRRLFLGRTLAATAGVVAVGTVGYGVRTVLAGPTLKHVTIPLRGLHPDLVGYRLAVVADIHAGATAGWAHVERIVKVINEAGADIVSIVGDLEDGTVANLRTSVAPLRDIAAREGTYFVTGNHEYFGDWRPWLRELPRLGVTPLRNERTAITRGAGTFDLAGVNDVTGAGAGDPPDYGKALNGRDTSRPVVLMAHQPVQVTDSAAHGVDLQISGHTHGGQMWPLHYVIRLTQPSLAGLSRVDRTWLYVTRGAGYWGPPVRVGAPPDVTVITLARA